MDYVLNMEHVSKSYGEKRVLQDVSLHLKRGKIYGLVGSNGSGKTTIIKIILGVSSRDSGELRLFGNSCPRQELYRVGSLIESPALFNDLTGSQNLKYYSIQRGFSHPFEINQLLSLVGLANYRNVKVKKYSLGMRQRLSIALAMLGKPELLILDEPINSIDPQGIVEIRQLLRRLVEDLQVTILISSHILEELSQLADYFTILEKGSIIKEISAAELAISIGKYIAIETSDVARCCAVLETEMGIFNYCSKEQGTVYVYEEQQRAAKINKTLIEHGVEVSAFYIYRESIEDIYMRLLETGGQHV